MYKKNSEARQKMFKDQREALFNSFEKINKAEEVISHEILLARHGVEQRSLLDSRIEENPIDKVKLLASYQDGQEKAQKYLNDVTNTIRKNESTHDNLQSRLEKQSKNLVSKHETLQRDQSELIGQITEHEIKNILDYDEIQQDIENFKLKHRNLSQSNMESTKKVSFEWRKGDLTPHSLKIETKPDHDFNEQLEKSGTPGFFSGYLKEAKDMQDGFDLFQERKNLYNKSYKKALKSNDKKQAKLIKIRFEIEHNDFMAWRENKNVFNYSRFTGSEELEQQFEPEKYEKRRDGLIATYLELSDIYEGRSKDPNSFAQKMQRHRASNQSFNKFIEKFDSVSEKIKVVEGKQEWTRHHQGRLSSTWAINNKELSRDQDMSQILLNIASRKIEQLNTIRHKVTAKIKSIFPGYRPIDLAKANVEEIEIKAPSFRQKGDTLTH